MNFLIKTLGLGLTNLMLHKLRSLLTALGIIFGVAAVITMVAIGEGNKQRALADIQELGANNIIVRSVKPPDSTNAGEAAREMLSYGITRIDSRRIEQTVQPIDRIVSLKIVSTSIARERFQSTAAVLGTTPELMEVTSIQLQRGRYLTESDLQRVEPVAVVGAEIAARLFPLHDPIESTIRINNQSFRVVGVLRRVGLAGGAGSALVGRDLNFDVHIPLSTAAARFGDITVRRSSGGQEAVHMELSEMYIQVPPDADVRVVAEQVRRVLQIGHPRGEDVTTIVPLELLEQKERTMRLFNYLMVAIASISLLVGGIGIMNIMLASVTERTREIGIRRALGATRGHVVAQFLVETTVLSGLGGVTGIMLGLAAVAVLAIIAQSSQVVETPQITTWSIVLSFAVSTLIGIFFGLYPAVKASQQDPIVALRHD